MNVETLSGVKTNVLCEMKGINITVISLSPITLHYNNDVTQIKYLHFSKKGLVCQIKINYDENP